MHAGCHGVPDVAVPGDLQHAAGGARPGGAGQSRAGNGQRVIDGADLPGHAGGIGGPAPSSDEGVVGGGAGGGVGGGGQRRGDASAAGRADAAGGGAGGGIG